MSDSENDSDDRDIPDPSLPENVAAIDTFWNDFTRDTNELRKRLGQPKLEQVVDEDYELLKREERAAHVFEGVTEAEGALRREYGVHYDYIEGIGKLLFWCLFMMVVYQYSGYHELLYEFSHIISVAFVLPFVALLAMYWVEIKKDEERMLENARSSRELDKKNKATRKEQKARGGKGGAEGPT